MPTPKQLKMVGLKSTVLTTVDKYAYNNDFNNMQMLYDMTNIAVTEYITKDRVGQMLEPVSSLFPAERKEMLVNLLLNITQDMIANRVIPGWRKRSLVEDLVLFSLAEVVYDESRKRVAFLQE